MKSRTSFYEELNSLIRSVQSKFTILGDFNTHVRTDHHAWARVPGSHRIRKCNSNGQFFLWMCASHDLAITNKIFQLPTDKKILLIHPRSKHLLLVNYVIVRMTNRRDVRVVKACVAQTAGQTIISSSKMNFNIQPRRRPQGQKMKKKLNVLSIRKKSTAQDLQLHMENTPADLEMNQPSTEEQWALFRDAVHSITLETLVPVKRNNQNCLMKTTRKFSAPGREKLSTEGPLEWPHLHGNDGCLQQDSQHSPGKTSAHARCLADWRGWRDPKICRQEQNQEILCHAESCLWTGVLPTISLLSSNFNWQCDPGEMGKTPDASLYPPSVWHLNFIFCTHILYISFCKYSCTNFLLCFYLASFLYNLRLAIWEPKLAIWQSCCRAVTSLGEERLKSKPKTNLEWSP